MTNLKTLPRLKELKPKTQQLYATAIKTILNGKEAGVQSLVESFCSLVNQQQTNDKPLSTKTLNLYKSATKKWLISEIEFCQNNDIPSDQAKSALQTISNTEINLKETQVGEQKKTGSKKFTNDTVQAIKERRQNGLSQKLLYFIEANLIVGLRPTEWFTAGLCSNVTDRHVCLVLENAKFSEERGIGHGTHRYIDISSLNPLRRAVIDRYLGYVSEIHSKHHLRPDKYYGQLSGDFNRLKLQMKITTKETLYSTRHQAIANLKSSGEHTAEDIADMMGHKGTTTARHHYGAKKSGSIVGVLPNKAKELGNHYELQAENHFNQQIGKNHSLIQKACAELGVDPKIGQYFENGSHEQVSKIQDLKLIAATVCSYKSNDSEPSFKVEID